MGVTMGLQAGYSFVTDFYAVIERQYDSKVVLEITNNEFKIKICKEIYTLLC